MSTIIIRYRRKEYEVDDEKEEFRFIGWGTITEAFPSDNYRLEMKDDRCGYFYAGSNHVKMERISGKNILDLRIDGYPLICAGKTIWADRKEIGVRDEGDDERKVEI